MIDHTKINLTINRTKEQWLRLLDSVKLNSNHPDTGKPVLTKDEQGYYIDEINFKITGQRHSKGEVMNDILQGAADISDLGLN